MRAAVCITLFCAAGACIGGQIGAGVGVLIGCVLEVSLICFEEDE